MPVNDVLFVCALQSGLQPQEITEVLSGALGAQLRLMHRAGLLTWELSGLADAGVPATGVDLVVPHPTPGAVPLSRFAVVHREAGVWLVDSGLSPWRVRLTSKALRMLDDGDDHGWLNGLLAVAGMLDGEDERAADWSLHDRLFHMRTRGPQPFLGPPARARGVPPEPGVRPAEEGVDLPRPNGPEIDEPSLWQATEQRRTIRDFAQRPVSLEALGHLLWRTLRVKAVTPADPLDPQSYDTVWRPVPSGGAMHATDLWLFCDDVEDLPRGTYRYDPVAHRLVPVPGSQPVVGSRPAPVVGLITARHRRTAWKYEPIALSLELKDVGVQMMALQLTAAAVGLSVVPLGGGPAHQATDSLGLDPLVDAPVGEFLLGPV